MSEGIGSRTVSSALDDPIGEATTVGWNDPALVATHYLELLLSSGDSVAEALAILTDPACYPAVIHCSVGKDRTGILVALVLSSIGVEDAVVVADYALSGMGAARLALRLRDLCAANPSELDRFLPALLSAEPATMHCFLAKLREKFGSVHGYLEDLGMGSAPRYLCRALAESGKAEASASADRHVEAREQFADTPADLVADRAHRVE